MRKSFFISLCCICFSHLCLTQGVSKRPTFKAQFIQLPGSVELEYTEQGDASGTPVIFLHGFTDSWHSFESTLPHLPKSIRAFAITQRGHGHSFKPEAAYQMKDFASDVAAFIKAKNLDQVVIVGHSMGGLVAQQFALDFPKLTKAIVIVDSDASFIDNPGIPEFLNEVTQLSDPVAYEFADAFQKSTLSRPIDSTYYQLLVGESLKVPAHVWREAMQQIMEANYSSQLSLIQKPTLIFWGDKDSICLGTDQELLQKGIKGSELIVYKGVGHALHWEEPERFAKDLTSFIVNQ